MPKQKEFGISKSLREEFQNLITEWAEDNLIDYPWRHKRNPYKVLISEILLTRTKAGQVEPVFKEFMKQYPTLETFSKIKLNKVKNLIQSLGLLFRANTLKALSSKIKTDFNNSIPEDLKKLKSLKGIGDYGANAILCFGFGQRRPILDSNFIRIYERVFGIKSKTKTSKSDKFLWEFTEYMLPQKNFIQFNYAILDLGGQICRPQSPNCEICFLKSICRYFIGSK